MSTDLTPSDPPPDGQFLIYQDGSTHLRVRIDGQTTWLTQKQIADLFQVTVANVNQHLRTIYEERELSPGATIKNYLIVQTEGTRQVSRLVEHYNLDAIIAIGYRVRSARGTQFRQWATARLSELLVKGFTMDDQRLKNAGNDTYFEELLARIRDIRSSERVFWRKVLDIYATSMDYNGDDEQSQVFFKTVQNKIHWAAHGHTAAEIVYERADSVKPNMGLTSWAGGKPRKTDVSVAKNYLNAEEIEASNRIVTAYLEFAELQAMNRKPMYMTDWIAKLNDFLTLSDRDVLSNAGSISHESAVEKAENEYAKYKVAQAKLPQPVDEDFEKTLDELKKIEKQKPKKKPKPKDSED